jgi:hypothetical protein
VEVGQHHGPAALTAGKTRYPLYRRLRGPKGRSGRVQKITPPTEIRSPDLPANSESPYRLSYPGSTRINHILIKRGITDLNNTTFHKYIITNNYENKEHTTKLMETCILEIKYCKIYKEFYKHNQHSLLVRYRNTHKSNNL